jgi:hypothetical protein
MSANRTAEGRMLDLLKVQVRIPHRTAQRGRYEPMTLILSHGTHDREPIIGPICYETRRNACQGR